MEIRRAEPRDLSGIISLLHQVHDVHSQARPDIFKRGSRKYTDDEILAIIADDSTPVFVSDNDGFIDGYCFCIFKEVKNDMSLSDLKSLYIDDLCVDASVRGEHIGTRLFEFVTAFAKEHGCSQLKLNVWSFNGGAMRFYEKCGMRPLSVIMEKII